MRRLLELRWGCHYPCIHVYLYTSCTLYMCLYLCTAKINCDKVCKNQSYWVKILSRQDVEWGHWQLLPVVSFHILSTLEILDIPYVTHRSPGCGKKPLAVTASGFFPHPVDLCATKRMSRISQVDRMWNEVTGIYCQWPLSTSWWLTILI